jgi:DNA-binding response OmpR family regulator
MLPVNQPRVLVVDDVADAADSLALLLNIWGYGAEACYDGMAALAIARSYRPQVVVLDIGIPRMDGFEVARRLRAQPGLEQSVFMAISGHGQQAYRTRARQMGFDHYLLKPADPEEVHELLQRTLGRPRVSGTYREQSPNGGPNTVRGLGADAPTPAEALAEILRPCSATGGNVLTVLPLVPRGISRLYRRVLSFIPLGAAR